MPAVNNGTHTMRRRNVQPLDTTYANYWEQDKIDKSVWDGYFRSAMQGRGAEDVEVAADIADRMYLERMKREQNLVGK